MKGLFAGLALAVVTFAPDRAEASFSATLWRGETAYVDVPSGDAVAMAKHGADAKGGVSVSLARYTEVAYETKPGGVGMRSRKDVLTGAGGAEPDVCKVAVAKDAKPGVYSFGPLEVKVSDRVLPPPAEWKYFLDLWQHPWAVARYFKTKPFSKEHYEKMEPVWRALADCGCKALTVTILDLPWNHQCRDGYHSMVGRVKRADGSWAFDYSIFDEYVAFGRKCGLGPDIACYSMCPWGYMASWTGEDGKAHREKILPGTPAFEEYWGPFLSDFAAHLKEKGWLGDAYIAMDERKPDDVRAIAALVKAKAPELKIAMCGNRSPSQFSGMKIDNYSQGLIHLHKHPGFFGELEPRRREGAKTTFYVCCSAPHPNTFMESPADEAFWLGAYPAMTGFDGFLRWAANSWPDDPYKDASFKTKAWKAGDTFLIYPGGELSSRLVALRAGIVAAEKMRILREENGKKAESRIGDIASRYGYKEAIANTIDFKDFRSEVEAFVSGGGVFRAVSPDGLNELRLEATSRGLRYSVLRRGKTIVEPSGFSLDVAGRGWLNGTGIAPAASVRRIAGALDTPIYKKSQIDLAANETRVSFGDWAVVLHARNDGVAWRFETDFGGEMTIPGEATNVKLPAGARLCYTVAHGFESGWEKPAVTGSVESVPAGHPQIVMTPWTAEIAGAGAVCVTESDLRDYPGLNFYRKEGEKTQLRSWQAGVPSALERGRRKEKVKSRERYLAKTKGARTFPWRVFVLADGAPGLVESDIVYALAEPSRIGAADWVKPGQVAWDWWNGFQITDVPGLETGCNFETYKAYVDFAAANGIAYVIMDEGWSERLDPMKPLEKVNVQGVIEYAKLKGVDVILWMAWAQLIDRDRRAAVFDRCAAMGAKGFKIDFIERDDQFAERFLEETAADAAARRLVVLYHGIHKPAGLQRTYPNILNYEGVYGLEQGGSIGGRPVVVSNDVNLVFTRMVAGFMDYTPGAMRNRTLDAPPFVKGRDTRACYGTRCHQLALYPLFEAPIQMLCDSPTQYRTAPECTAFIVSVPTVWDETRAIGGGIGGYAAIARRKGDDWWLGAITDWTPREIEIPLSFLGEGAWKSETFEDAPDAGANAESYVRRAGDVDAGRTLKVRLAPGGGFAARFSRADR